MRVVVCDNAFLQYELELSAIPSTNVSVTRIAPRSPLPLFSLMDLHCTRGPR